MADGLKNQSDIKLSRGGKQTSLPLNSALSEDAVFDNRVLGGGRFLESLVKRGVFVSSNPEKVFADLATQVADHFGLEPSTVEMPGSPALYRQKR